MSPRTFSPPFLLLLVLSVACQDVTGNSFQTLNIQELLQRGKTKTSAATAPWFYGKIIGLGNDANRYQILQKILDPTEEDQLILINNLTGSLYPYPLKINCTTISNNQERTMFSTETLNDDVVVLSVKTMGIQGANCILEWWDRISNVPLFLKGMTSQIIELGQFGLGKGILNLKNYNDTD